MFCFVLMLAYITIRVTEYAAWTWPCIFRPLWVCVGIYLVWRILRGD